MRKERVMDHGSWVVGLVFLLITPVYAEDLDSILSNVQKTYENISDMKASFVQETTSATFKDTQKSEGIVYFKKPGMMRWEYSNPNKDVIVNNGETIWVYQPDLGQVMVSKFDKESSPLSKHFLSGMGNVKNDFDVKLGEETPFSYTLILVPKTQQPNIRKIHLTIDKKTFMMNKTASFDPFGNIASVRFIDVKTNTNLQKSIFNFEIPKGVKVVTPQ
ncbi:MAG: outer membrane lipoprotein chaperone LolA [Deltaproteobacteria bacterium]|nr:outer membrane lipoprotein chaperone LolA [Deltaproteobacteria bacterium]